MQLQDLDYHSTQHFTFKAMAAARSSGIDAKFLLAQSLASLANAQRQQMQVVDKEKQHVPVLPDQIRRMIALVYQPPQGTQVPLCVFQVLFAFVSPL